MEEITGSGDTQKIDPITGQSIVSTETGTQGVDGNGVKQDADAPMPEEIAKMSSGDAKKTLWNSQKLQGKWAKELGDLRKENEDLKGKAGAADAISSLLFSTDNPPSKKSDELKPPEKKVEPVAKTENETFLSKTDIEKEYDRDVVELGLEEATKRMTMRLSDLSRNELILENIRLEQKKEGKGILENFLKEETNKIIFDTYWNALSEAERNTWKIVTTNTPIFVKHLIASAKGETTPETLEKIKQQAIKIAEQKKTETDLGAGSPVGGAKIEKKDTLHDSLVGVAKDGLL